MQTDTHTPSFAAPNLRVVLDGQPVGLPAERRSLAGIRSYLETLALERQRILCSFSVDGQPAHLAQAPRKTFAFVAGETMELENVPLQLVRLALQQTADAREQVQSTVVLVLINDGCVARECWWNLARELKQPLLTLSLLPDDSCGHAGAHVSPSRLRKWQLQQLAAVLKDVDDACWCEDTSALSNALENRVVPWLDKLRDSLVLLQETLQAGVRAAGRT